MISRNIILSLYSLATFILTPLAVGLLALSPRGRLRWLERWGRWEIKGGSYIWFHGASAGEVAGLLPLIKALKAEGEENPVLVTATSVTGLDMAASVTEHRHLLPFDSSLWYSSIFRKITPRVVVISETELWPGLYSELKRRKIPLVLVNSRISDATFPRYIKLKPLLRQMLSIPTAICVGDSISRERFCALGAAEERVFITGNTKYDVELASGEGEIKRQFWNDDIPVILLGSIRPEEDKVWFPALKESLQKGERFHLIVAPRHQEKFEYFAQLLKGEFGEFDRRSTLLATESSPRSDILLLDTFGELRRLYSLADLSFIGASLVPIGGHNPLEASMYGSYVTMGPHYHVVREVMDELQEAEAGEIVNSKEEVELLLTRFFKNRAEFQSKGAKGHAVWKRHKGASSRVLSHVKSVLKG